MSLGRLARNRVSCPELILPFLASLAVFGAPRPCAAATAIVPHLHADSPLVGGTCGTIGPEGVGCAATTAVPTSPPAIRAFALGAAGPNPASGPVTIEYSLPRSAAINLTVHDLMGREVAHLASGIETEGRHTARWPGTAHGLRASPGFYFVRFAYPGGQQSRRILLRH
jgi:hypothetical protein